MHSRLKPYVRRTGAVGVAARLEFVASSGHDDLGVIAVGVRKQQRCGFCGKTGHKRGTCKNVHMGMRFLKLPSPFLKRWKKLQPSALGFHQEKSCLLFVLLYPSLTVLNAMVTMSCCFPFVQTVVNIRAVSLCQIRLRTMHTTRIGPHEVLSLRSAQRWTESPQSGGRRL